MIDARVVCVKMEMEYDNNRFLLLGRQGHGNQPMWCTCVLSLERKLVNGADIS